MVFEELAIPGVFKITSDHFSDIRGTVTKVFSEELFRAHGLPPSFAESFFSISHKNVIRGMHFQTAPYICGKLVYISAGSVCDVVLDIRKESPAFGQHVSLELSYTNHTAIYIPEGCAHGFLSREDDTCTVYLQTKMRDVNAEAGIRFDSFGMDWGMSKPIISERNAQLPTFEVYTQHV